MPNVWTKDAPNLLMSENLANVQEHLQKGLVVAFHWHYQGCRSFDYIVFEDNNQLMTYINKSVPGDAYSFWSLPEAIERNISLATFSFGNADKNFQLTSTDLEPLTNFLSDPHSEIVVVFQSLTDSLPSSCVIYDHEFYAESFNETLEKYSQSKANIYVFPIDAIFGENGYSELFFLNTKYPNQSGEIPIGGSY